MKLWLRIIFTDKVMLWPVSLVLYALAVSVLTPSLSQWVIPSWGAVYLVTYAILIHRTNQQIKVEKAKCFASLAKGMPVLQAARDKIYADANSPREPSQTVH